MNVLTGHSDGDFPLFIPPIRRYLCYTQVCAFVLLSDVQYPQTLWLHHIPTAWPHGNKGEIETSMAA